MSINLRTLLLGALFLVLPAFGASQTWTHEGGTLSLDAPPKRIVALNWAATETLLLLGTTPVGVADKSGYNAWVNKPKLPDDVANVGTRVAPSLEAIAELKPDLIVTSTEMAPAHELLEQIAPTYVISVYKPDSHPFDRAKEMLRVLSDMLDREAQADAVLTDIEQTLKQQRDRLERAKLTDTAIALISFQDNRHVRIYTKDSLYQAALDSLGLTNAWPSRGNYWGFASIGLESVAQIPNSRLVVIEPLVPGLADSLEESPFWTYLPPVRNQQIYQIPNAWSFGGVHQVKILAKTLTEALLKGGSNNVL
ncbi:MULTISPECIES: iron-siderophore ABC transporter substrate-binding protein [unclassified Marinobacter]|uniref:iron-siderophore ABC transporter substrate-binding protein n=1 Tax=Marinobacter sp. AL4B TaxID=2871173 RepID=UPI001056ABCD|nr:MULTISPECIES: iron-siderophore ABC transporter substrate-binding protein [unclassified Marinobacter]MBZ0334247.1 iron-siderophore ABC transporter substrate-binding protein [Marinobacter sp. AL4B]